MTARQTADSFWAKVRRGATDECWPWTGHTNKGGYGTLRWSGRSVLAHRVAAWLSGMVESIHAPTDLSADGFVLHRCDNPPCCNPSHYRIGTYGQNQKEAYDRGMKVQPRGPAHANAKLTAAQVAAIREAYGSGGVSQESLAKQYGVSQVAVGLVIRGVTYKEAV